MTPCGSRPGARWPGSGERGTLVPAPRDPRLAALHGEIAVAVGAARRAAALAEAEVERLIAALTALGAAPVAPADRP